ncbi:MAG: DUF302 domain-containing protein [Dehalococcoidia bacterium]
MVQRRRYKTKEANMWRRSGIITGLVLSLLLASVGLSQAQGRVEKVSKSSFNRTLRKLDRAFKASSLLILGEFNYQKMQKMVGRTIRPAKGFAYFRPDLGTPIFRNDPRAALEIPLKLLVRQRSDGKVVISYRKPSAVLKEYEGLSDLAKRLDDLVDKLTDVAVK